MRPLLFLLLAVPMPLAVMGCGSTNDSAPVACLEGDGIYLTALKDAPGEVALPGGAPISSCLVENQPGGELATVGASMIEAATKLNAEVRDEPGGPAGLRLGYLLGAAQRGAERTDGIHDELLRRLTAAARYSRDNRPLPATFLDAYQRGFDAGEARG